MVVTLRAFGLVCLAAGILGPPPAIADTPPPTVQAQGAQQDVLQEVHDDPTTPPAERRWFRKASYQGHPAPRGSRMLRRAWRWPDRPREAAFDDPLPAPVETQWTRRASYRGRPAQRGPRGLRRAWRWPDRPRPYVPPPPSDTEFEVVHDPWEPFNRWMFEFNLFMDTYGIRPVAILVEKALPLGVRRSIERFFFNIRTPSRFANLILQRKPAWAIGEIGRFAINSTVGLLGLLDPAKDWFYLEAHDEDFGQTLGFYGVGPGPYMVLPFFGPSTVRDTFGFGVDLAADPVTYLVSGSVVVLSQVGAEFSNRVNHRSLNLDLFEDVDRFTLDPYLAVQDFYIQYRERAIAE
jgi:phospholipid-binding lipoprotein MlaA